MGAGIKKIVLIFMSFLLINSVSAIEPQENFSGYMTDLQEKIQKSWFPSRVSGKRWAGSCKV